MKKVLSVITGSLLFVISNAQLPTNVPSNGLIAYYPFNGNANDISGNSNHGTVTGAALTTDKDGASNSAYNFNGVSNSIKLGATPFVAMDNLDGSDFSISLWFNVNDAKGTLFMNFGWGITAYLDNSIPTFGHVGIWSNAVWFYVPSNSPISTNNWYNLVLVKNGNSQLIYVNGQLKGSSTSSAAGIGGQVYVGGNPIDNNGWVNGKIDDIGLWSRALTSYEITKLYKDCDLNPTISSVNVNPGSTASITATLSDLGASFKWQTNVAGLDWLDIPSNSTYSNVSTKSLSINNVDLSNHLQEFRVITTSGNCIDTSNVGTINITDTCLTSVMDTLVINASLTGVVIPNINTVKVYPNPTNSSITIDNGNYSLMNGYTVSIKNLSGQTVYTKLVTQQQFNIDLSTLTGKGIYFINITDNLGKVIETRKIVLQ